ncbi:hypothetical protein LTR10_003052 [Elasticomyces elasticus]|nr:hypothetical protein LTR10_003052 [Elasticomyces elasticus]KAK4969328.1 hypothetical protein LTR42_008595 [Elasticomyces elasticus]
MGEQKQSNLETTISHRLDRRRSSSTIRRLTTTPSNAVDFSSNDFLSLASNDELRQSFLEELARGPSNTGSGGSRLLDGNSTYAEALEHRIAAFHKARTGLLCNSGFDANSGDVIVYDEAIHASVHDGMKLSRAGKCVSFAHNDVEALRTVLYDCVAADPAVKDGRRNVFVAVETVYSMDGDIAPLQAIVNLLNDESVLPASNSYFIVDEAHSNGIYGARGRGLVSELGLEEEVAVRLHTFGKALAANGAIILCSPLIREYLVNYARPLIYTTFMSFPALAAIKASYGFLETGRAESLARNLMDVLIPGLHARLLALEETLSAMDGSSAMALLRVPWECPKSAIFSVLTSEPKTLAAYCQSKGFVVRGIVPPTVPAGTERIRICLHGGNTVQQLDGLVECIRQWVETRSVQGPEASNVMVKARL